jgi:hypothetical protein
MPARPADPRHALRRRQLLWTCLSLYEPGFVALAQLYPPTEFATILKAAPGLHLNSLRFSARIG